MGLLFQTMVSITNYFFNDGLIVCTRVASLCHTRAHTHTHHSVKLTTMVHTTHTHTHTHHSVKLTTMVLLFVEFHFVVM